MIIALFLYLYIYIYIEREKFENLMFYYKILESLIV